MALQSMSFDNIERLQVDDADRRLYWDGNPVVTGSVVTLQFYERVLATIAAAGALFAGLHPFGVTFGWW